MVGPSEVGRQSLHDGEQNVVQDPQSLASGPSISLFSNTLHSYYKARRRSVQTPDIPSLGLEDGSVGEDGIFEPSYQGLFKNDEPLELIPSELMNEEVADMTKMSLAHT